MKKFLTLVLVAAVVCTSVFAGTFTLKTTVGYDTLKYSTNTKNWKFDIDLPGELVSVDEKEVERYMEGVEYEDAVKKISTTFYGPSFGLDVDAKVSKHFSIFADAAYILPVKTKVELGKIAAGLDDILLAIGEDSLEFNPNEAYLNGISIELGKHQINQILDEVSDLINDELNDATEEPPTNYGTIDLKYYMNAIKARVGAAYSYNLKKAPITFTAKIGAKFDATFTALKAKFVPGVSVERFVGIDELDFSQPLTLKLANNFYSFGATAAFGTTLKCTDHIGVSLEGALDCGLFNLSSMSVDVKYKPTKVDNLLKADFRSFAVAPTFAGKVAFEIAF